MKLLRYGLLACILTALAAAKAPGQSKSGYVLRVNDLIEIKVFQEDDLTTQTRISKTGYIAFPLLGSVQLAGKTLEQAIAELTQKLGQDYLINPQVTLTVVEYAKERVTVLGQVQSPGSIEIPNEGNLDLLGAIAMAGGYTPIADPGKVTVRRHVGSEDKVYLVNAKKLAADKEAKPFYVRPDDVITVGESIF